MTNKTVLSDEEILPPEFKSGNDIQVTRAWVSKERIIEILRATEQAVLQSPEIQQLRKDADRLDSGCIMTEEFDELGMTYIRELRGIDLRAAIDAAMEVKP